MSEQFARRTVEIEDGVTLHFIEAGSGKPLLIIPSWSLSAAAYKRQLHGPPGSERSRCGLPRESNVDFSA